MFNHRIRIALCAAATSLTVQATPPFSGTSFIESNIVRPSDYSALVELKDLGRGYRQMFDRRVNNWIYVNAYLIEARFADGLSSEIQVNPEFGNASAAMLQAEKWGWPIGQLPYASRRDVASVWIHKGTEPFGGGNNNLLIHADQGDIYLADGDLEEILLHESAHTSIDADHAATDGWLGAQSEDAEFISIYAQNNPTREDIAESYLPFVAVRSRADRISMELKDTINNTIPNRLAYFDEQSFDISYGPVCSAPEIHQRIENALISSSESFSGCFKISAVNITILNGAALVLQAGSALSITPPFAVQSGGTFRAVIAFPET